MVRFNCSCIQGRTEAFNSSRRTGGVLEIQNLETNDTHKAATSAGGLFAFRDLPFGTYRLQVTKTGFTTRIFQSIEVQTGRVTDIAASLSIGSTAETIIVSSQTP